MVSKPGWATGLGSFAFHPEFAKNGLFYTSHTEPGGTAKADVGYTDSLKVFMEWVLTEWKADDPQASVFKGSSREILRVNNSSQAHGMQELTFNPQAKKGASADYGLLYVGYGDGGTAENGFPEISNHGGKGMYSSIWRIDPLGKTGRNGQYGIPTTNPFFGKKEFAGEVYAYGFRNPNRIFWDEKGQLHATDLVVLCGAQHARFGIGFVRIVCGLRQDDFFAVKVGFLRVHQSVIRGVFFAGNALASI
jgi:glucose/arabinose dehydrogenase